jgi:hypothetical protein
MEKKIKWKLSKVDTKAVSRGQKELIGRFKMAAGDVISMRGQVMEYTYISTGIKREFVWIATGRCKLLEEDRWPFILVDRLSLASRGLLVFW